MAREVHAHIKRERLASVSVCSACGLFFMYFSVRFLVAWQSLHCRCVVGYTLWYLTVAFRSNRHGSCDIASFQGAVGSRQQYMERIGLLVATTRAMRR